MIRHDTGLTEAAKPAAQTIRSLIRMTRVRRPERTLPVPRTITSTTSVLLVLTKAAEGRWPRSPKAEPPGRRTPARLRRVAPRWSQRAAGRDTCG